MYGLMVMMHFHFGRRQAMECIIMPIFICVVPEWIFLCPRGWCYATRCRFYGDGRALIWHDGRGDKSKKLVITNSSFDAQSPTILGRWHHDSQFFIINCQMSEQILDCNIGYAYSDKVLDPCPWGQRVYYYGCRRQEAIAVGWTIICNRRRVHRHFMASLPNGRLAGSGIRNGEFVIFGMFWLIDEITLLIRGKAWS